MMKINNKQKICIICEGYEETEYMNTLINKNFFSNIYSFTTINCKSSNNIFYRYIDKYQSDSYSLILIFCDTDKAPCNNYKTLKENINSFHGADVAKYIIIFGNPTTMQIIISHFCDEKLTSQSKKVNAKYIEKHAGVKNYQAKEEQRKELFVKINKSNYNLMKTNIEKLSKNDDQISTTNVLEFLEKFEDSETTWIETINKKL